MRRLLALGFAAFAIIVLALVCLTEGVAIRRTLVGKALFVLSLPYFVFVRVLVNDVFSVELRGIGYAVALWGACGMMLTYACMGSIVGKGVAFVMRRREESAP